MCQSAGAGWLSIIPVTVVVIVAVAVDEVSVAGCGVHEWVVKEFVLFLFIGGTLVRVTFLAFGLVLLYFLRFLLVHRELVYIPALLNGPVLFQVDLLGVVVHLFGLYRVGYGASGPFAVIVGVDEKSGIISAWREVLYCGE